MLNMVNNFNIKAEDGIPKIRLTRLFLLFLFFAFGGVVDIFYYNAQLVSLPFLLASFLYLIFCIFWRRKIPHKILLSAMCFVMCFFVFVLTNYFGGVHDDWVEVEVRRLGKQYLEEKYRAGQCPDMGKRLIHGNLIIFHCSESNFLILFNKFNFKRDSYNVLKDDFSGVRDI